jgi:hypothetical protein
MMWFGRRKDGAVSKVRAAAIQGFELAIRREESRLYGLALYFECLSLFRSGQEGLIETERKQFRNLIQGGRKQVDDATTLLEHVRAGSQPPKAIEHFVFTYSNGHPTPVELIARADALVAAFRAVFPVRPMAQPFTPEETYRLLEAAAVMPGIADAIHKASGVK